MHNLDYWYAYKNQLVEVLVCKSALLQQEPHYQRELHTATRSIANRQSDHKQTTLLVSEDEFKKHWVTPE